jgi:SAM-dependent methyltransferase
VLAVARDSHGHLPGVTFRRGDATSTGLPAGSADVVFERALVHHTPDLAAVVAEARRLLRPGGVHLVQDRSRADSSQPGSASHPRGWFFEVFPHLTDVEDGRRPSPERLGQVLGAGGFSNVSTTSLWEVRRRHDDREDYLAEIARRTGRSILHHLTDAELEHLVVQLRRRLPAGPVIEQDRWTLWRAERDPA